MFRTVVFVTNIGGFLFSFVFFHCSIVAEFPFLFTINLLTINFTNCEAYIYLRELGTGQNCKQTFFYLHFSVFTPTHRLVTFDRYLLLFKL